MTRQTGDPEIPTVVLDFDGTLVPAMWPERPTTFMPGAVENMQVLHRAGIRLVIDSARLSTVDPWKNPRPPGERESEIQWMRDLLDRHGLTFIDIHTGHGKPGGDVYVDDKGERYNGGKRSWDKVAAKILMRLTPVPKIGGTS